MAPSIEELVEQCRKISRKLRQDAKDPAKARAFLIGAGIVKSDQPPGPLEPSNESSPLEATTATLVSATYADGVLRPAEPLALPEGATVRIFVLAAGAAGAWDPAAAVAASERIAALPTAVPSGTVSARQDHDAILYVPR